MAIIYSYPHAVPTISDMVLGAKFRENEGISTNSFYISDIVDIIQEEIIIGITPPLQQVVNSGNTIVVPTTVAKGIDITLSDLSTVQQFGVSVSIPPQTGPFPAYIPAPDAFVANINGQIPGTLAGSVVGFLTNATGDDNIGFYANLNANSTNSTGYVALSSDAHTGDYFKAVKNISGGFSEVFKVANNGNTTANSFIKIGGLATQYLMADGTTTDILGITPDLQQVVTEGNIVTSGTSQLTLTANELSILNPSTLTGTALRRDSLRFTIFGDGKNNKLDLSCDELTSNSVQTFQNADGVIALLSDITTPDLQQVTDNGGNQTTNSITITSEETSGLVVEGFRWGIRANNNPEWSAGGGIYAYSEQGYGVYAESGEFGDGGIYASSGVKPGGGSWTASSDIRVKENIEVYSKGLEDILLINPVTYDYNGKGGMPKSTGYIGIIAQEIKDIFPETITTYKSKLEETDTEDTELYRFEASALVYALINAVKELKAEIELLKGN
jgi:hypothetical protein